MTPDPFFLPGARFLSNTSMPTAGIKARRFVVAQPLRVFHPVVERELAVIESGPRKATLAGAPHPAGRDLRRARSCVSNQGRFGARVHELGGGLASAPIRRVGDLRPLETVSSSRKRARGGRLAAILQQQPERAGLRRYRTARGGRPAGESLDTQVAPDGRAGPGRDGWGSGSTTGRRARAQAGS